MLVNLYLLLRIAELTSLHAFISRDRRYKELDDGTMYISRLKTKDAAIYTCTKLGYDIRVVTVVIAGIQIILDHLLSTF